MGIVFRQSVKTTIVTFTGALLGAFVVYLSTHFIPKQQLGFTRNLTNQALVLGQVFAFGLHGTLAIYIHKYDDDARKRKTLIGLCLVVPLFLLALFSVVYFLCNNWLLHHFQAQDIPFLKRYFFWLPLFSLFFIYQIIVEQFLISQFKVALSTFLREIVLRVLNIFLIILFGFNYINFDTLVAGTVLIYFVPVFFLFFFSIKQKSFGIAIDIKAFSRKEYRDILHFTWYHALLGISVNLLGYLDQLMLAPLDKRGLSSLAVYNVAVYIISVLLIPYKSMMTTTYPVLTRAFKENDKVRINDVFVRSCLNILIVTVIVAVLIICNLHNATAIIKNGYDDITPIVLILLIGRMIDISTGMNDLLLSISNYYKANFYFSIGLVIFILFFNRLLIPHYGIYGAAWSTSIALSVYNIVKYIFVWKKLGLQPFSINTIYVVFAGIIAFIAGNLLSYMRNSYVDVLLRSLIIIIIYALVLLWLKPSTDLQEYIASVKKHKKLY